MSIQTTTARNYLSLADWRLSQEDIKDALEYIDLAQSLLLRQEPIEIELKLEKQNAPTSPTIRAA